MRRSRTTRTAALAALVVAGVAACGSDEAEQDVTAAAEPPRPPGKVAASAATVRIASFRYLPRVVTIRAGGRVTFVDEDRAPHTATAEDGTFDTDRLETGERGLVTFTNPGTYRYYCVYHRFMEAVVNVEERNT